uniref:Uncharacterized protein n=1 Tax=OCS116 cluster bacterium TaxID=2030921 RepID=A0A2A4YPT2_9PROT
MTFLRDCKLSIVLILTLGLTACVMLSGDVPSQVEIPLTRIVKDKKILKYLLDEAKRAHVSKVILTGNAMLIKQCASPNAYGCATFESGLQQGEIYLNIEVHNGTNIVNITHKIAHVGAFRSSCFAHGNLWLEYLMEMAKRFETQFPNSKWEHSTPTGSVRTQYKRYAKQRSHC